MLQAVIDAAPKRLGPCRVDVITTYPAGDRAEPPRSNPDADVHIVSATPLQMVAMLPLAILAWLLRKAGRSPRAACRMRAMRSMVEADVVVDISGISFVDGRGMATLVYNTLITGTPLLIGRPVVKCAQALGPFEQTPNRQVARRVLSRCEAVCPRGKQTREHLDQIGLPSRTRVMPASDLAFLMEVPQDATERAAEIVARHRFEGSPVGVLPSSVVERYCAEQNIDYIAVMATLIDSVAERTGRRVMLIPHSARADDRPGRMNDRPTCRAIHERLSRPDSCALVDESLPPTVLRALIQECEVVATSRFHAMISALATSTPVLVVGWSHKYAEVLSQIGLEDWVVDFSSTDASLADRLVELDGQADDVRKKITAGLPGLQRDAAVNLDAIERGLGQSPAAPTVSSDTPSDGIVRHDLSGVIENDMCIGCGACMFADPSVTVRLDPEKLIYQPDSPGNETAAAVCPAVQVDFAGLHERVFPDQEVGDYGVVDSVHLAQSTYEPRNTKASSGGLIKELLLHLLDRPDVDGVIALGHVQGLEFEPRLVTEPDGVDQLPGSIYHNLAQPKALEILRENPGRYVLVAIPCQLEGIYQYIHTCEPELAERIHTTIGLLCGWQYSHHSLKAICEFLGVDFDKIEDVAYRGGGPVGKLRIRTEDGKEVSASRRVDFGYQVAFDRHFNTPRCHLCVNHSNYLADIVVGDAWLPSTVFTKTGISLIICRKPQTRQMLDELANAGRVVASEVSTEEIRESQTDRVVFGNFAYAYADYLSELGLHHPDMVGPGRNRTELSPRNEVEHFHRELVRKLELQRQGRYQYLKWRKATLELPRFTKRYWTWFTVRILRVKSLKGERQEVPKEKLSAFR